jgi:hypothetical protein
MKFNKYLNNDDISDEMYEYLIDAVDYDVLQLYSKTKKFLYRGSERKIDTFDLIERKYKQRKTKHMSKWVYDILNNSFEKKFGWNVRNGVFTTSDRVEASIFGEPYVFIPKEGSKPKFVWSSKIKDLNYYLHDISNDVPNYKYFFNHYMTKEKILQLDCGSKLIRDLEKIPSHYTDKNLVNAIKSENEVIFYCDEYFLFKEGFIKRFL